MKIECEECGALYEPMTDAYKCPVCGTENYPPDNSDLKHGQPREPERRHAKAWDADNGAYI